MQAFNISDYLVGNLEVIMISNTRKCDSLGYPDTKYILTQFEVIKYLIKHSFERLIKLHILIIKCGENEEIKSPKYMQIKIRYPTAFTVVISFVFSS